ncbi:MAG: hypothetical protein AAF530_21655 [Pseudomonadota bacterium]
MQKIPSLKGDELEPILLWSPQAFCGEDLLQYLLCSSSNGIIFGAHIASDLAILHDLYVSRHRTSQECEGRRLQLPLTCQAIPDRPPNLNQEILPDPGPYLGVIADSYINILASCQDHANGIDRPVWGLSLPGWPVQRLEFFLTLIPGARIIIAHGDLLDAAAKAHAYGNLCGDQAVGNFLAIWQENMSAWQRKPPAPCVPSFHAQDFAVNPDAFCRSLSSATGIAGIAAQPASVGSVQTRIKNVFNRSELAMIEAATASVLQATSATLGKGRLSA